MRAIAVSGCSPYSWTSRAAHHRRPYRRSMTATLPRTCSGAGFWLGCRSLANSASTWISFMIRFFIGYP
jgi:hypothetical protein